MRCEHDTKKGKFLAWKLNVEVSRAEAWLTSAQRRFRTTSQTCDRIGRKHKNRFLVAATQLTTATSSDTMTYGRLSTTEAHTSL